MLTSAGGARYVLSTRICLEQIRWSWTQSSGTGLPQCGHSSVSTCRHLPGGRSGRTTGTGVNRRRRAMPRTWRLRPERPKASAHTAVSGCLPPWSHPVVNSDGGEGEAYRGTNFLGGDTVLESPSWTPQAFSAPLWAFGAGLTGRRSDQIQSSRRVFKLCTLAVSPADPLSTSRSVHLAAPVGARFTLGHGYPVAVDVRWRHEVAS